MTGGRRAAGGVRSAGRIVAGTLALALLLLTVEVMATIAVRQHRDRQELVTAQRLRVALQTFRPSERTGLPKDVPSRDLATENLVRTEPRRCVPLSLLAVAPPLDGQTWTGISGSPAEPVTTLTVRYADASTARRAMWDKRLALLRCRTVRLTFPPFDRPAQDFAVAAHARASTLVGDGIGYALVAADRRYNFFVRRYGNTLTWTYGDDAGVQVRRQVVLDLAARLVELSRQ
jgi:hypothetical protein